MFHKTLIGLGWAAMLGVSAMGAEVFVRIGPPRPMIERRGPVPGRDYVWVSGYHTWDGHSHVWVPGRWERPPRPRAHWVAHRWVRRRGGYVLVEGHWR